MILKLLKKSSNGMANAETYEEWRGAAERYDTKKHLERWKNMDQSRRYDYISIRTRLDRLRSYRVQKDDHGLLFALNEGIHGNMGGMGKPALYQKAKFGTKRLINDYIEEVVSALEHLASDEVDSISLEEKLEFFNRASHCYGRSALLLSGSGNLLHYHMGVVKTLWEQNLLPKIISGSSGGSVVAALVGTHSQDELEKIFDPNLMGVELEEEAGIAKYLSAVKPKQLSIGELHEMIEKLLPEITFQEAFDLTGIQINISVAPAELHQTSRLLNAITSPNVLVREAVTASCAVPGVYPPVGLAAKNVNGERQAYLPTRRWIDGSLTEDIPVKRLSRLYGVNHTIVSQTNPLVLPFINENKVSKGWRSTIKTAAFNTYREWTLAATKVLPKSFSDNAVLSTMMNRYVSLISQSYTGDINILPTRRIINVFAVLSSRTPEEISTLLKEGERSTWPKIERIRIQTRISSALDEILQDFQHKVIAKANDPVVSIDKTA